MIGSVGGVFPLPTHLSDLELSRGFIKKHCGIMNSNEIAPIVSSRSGGGWYFFILLSGVLSISYIQLSTLLLLFLT